MKNQFKICSEIAPNSDFMIVAVDGNVIGADQVFDHHRKDGAEVQMDELPEHFISERPLLFVSPSLDEDCVISSAILISGGISSLSNDVKKSLRDASMACDQLSEPNKLFYQLKDYDFGLLNEYKNNSNDKSIRYEILVNAVIELIKTGTFPNCIKAHNNGNFKRYITKQEITVLQSDIIRDFSDHCSFVNIKDNSFISPWVIYRTLRKTNKHIALIEYTSKQKGRVFTIGFDPLCDLNKAEIFSVFDELNKIEEYFEQNNIWGGRAGVGGSPQLTGSSLSPSVIIKTIERVIYEK